MQDVKSTYDIDDMLEFFRNSHKFELEHAKTYMVHAYNAYEEGLQRAWDERTKGMSKEERKASQDNILNGGNDKAWELVTFDLLKSIQDKYNVFIHHDETFFTVEKYMKYFHMSYSGAVRSDNKLADENFYIELDDDACFLIDLVDKMIVNAQNKKSIE